MAKYWALTAGALAGLFLSGCVSDYSFAPLPGPSSQGQTGADPSEPVLSGGPLSPGPSPSPSASLPTVCNPFGSTGSALSATSGLIGSLTYIPDTAPPVSTPTEIDALTIASFQPGAPSVVSENAAIYFQQLDVADQDFTDGFAAGNGQALEDLSGNVLVQFFGLHMDSSLELPASAAPGSYQLAVLSDDGSIVDVGNPGGSSAMMELINNDGTHSNTLGCASQTINLMPGVPTPLHVEYFQGPMVRLGLILFWRPVTSAQSLSDPLCNQRESDDFYFNDSASGPQPTSNYAGLLSRGWQVIPAADYVLPQGAKSPCASPSPSPSSSSI